MKKLMLGLMMAFAVTAEATVTIDGVKYTLDTAAKTASITGYDFLNEPTTIVASEVEYEGQKYTVTSVGNNGLQGCSLLESVALPNATTIGGRAFSKCENLKKVSLPNATTIGEYALWGCFSLASDELPSVPTIGEWAFGDCNKLETVAVSWGLLATPDRAGWMLRDAAKLVGPFTDDEIKNATYKVAVFAGEKLMSGENYEKGCAYYGLTPKTEPQIVKEGEIAVTKESIEAAKAEIVNVANGMVYLGVSVCSNADITASTANWAPVKFTEDTKIGLSADGTKLILPIPVAAQQGFMILQSGDAKVGVTSGGGPAANHAVQVAGGLYLDGGAEDEVVRIDGIDTRVLGNTAEKANDDSSDE